MLLAAVNLQALWRSPGKDRLRKHSVPVVCVFQPNGLWIFPARASPSLSIRLRVHHTGQETRDQHSPARSVVCLATEQTTGSHDLRPGSIRSVMAQMLSPRFSANPLSLFMFVLLSAPFRWKVVCWFWALRTAFSFFLKATIFDRLR